MKFHKGANMGKGYSAGTLVTLALLMVVAMLAVPLGVQAVPVLDTTIAWGPCPSGTLGSSLPEENCNPAPATPVPFATAQFWVAASDLSGAFECNLDGGGWAVCPGLVSDPIPSSSATYSLTFAGPLGDGSHTVQVRAVGDATPDSVTWIIDTTQPSGTVDILSGPPILTKDTTAKFVMGIPTTAEPTRVVCGVDDQTPTEFQDRTPMPLQPPITDSDYATCTSPFEPVVGDGVHTLTVGILDQAGNASSDPVATWQWRVDATAPVISIDTGPGPVEPTGSATLSFSADEPITLWECRIDAGAWGACTSPKSYVGLLDGSHTFEVRGTDKAGNIGGPASRTWTVDATPPDTSIIGGPSGTVNVATAQFDFTSDDPNAVFECDLDGGGWASCTSPKSYVGLSEAPHTFQVRAVDQFGRTDATPASRTWTIDLTPPDVTIDSGPTGTVAVSSATFTFSSTDGTATFECRLDGGGWSVCVSGITYSGLSNASHTFDVRAVDPAGNKTAPPASRTWTVDAPPAPNTTIDSGPSGTVGIDTAQFTFSSDQAPVTFECKLDGGGWGSCTSPASYTSLANGSHTFQVRATNTSTSQVDATPASRTWTVDVVNFRPDAMIASGKGGAFVGDGDYADEFFHDATGQIVKVKVRAGGTATFKLRFENEGVDPDRFTVKGCGDHRDFSVKYRTDGKAVTGGVTKGTHRTQLVPSGGHVDYRLAVTTASSARGTFDCNVRIRSEGDPDLYDVNRGVTDIR